LCENPDALSALHHYFKQRKITLDQLAVPKTDYRNEFLKPKNVIEEIIHEICVEGRLPNDFDTIYTEVKETEEYDADYPQFILRRHLNDLAKRRGYAGGMNPTSAFMKFIEPTSIHKQLSSAMTFKSRWTNSEESLRDRRYEFPPLKELRERFDSVTGSKNIWPNLMLTKLKVIKGGKEDEQVTQKAKEII
jgi:hypothetical protein